MVKILLVEDDPGIGKGLCITLKVESYDVTWVTDLKSLTDISLHDFQLILLDINLPDGNGIQFLKNIRQAQVKTPVILLTAKVDEESVEEGLLSGANDYIKKPFSNRELLARIRVAIRESQKHNPQLKYGNLQVHLDQRKITYLEKELDLNRREFDLLYHLITHAEAVVTRNTALELFDKDGEIFDRTIDSHISHIRTRLKKVNANDIIISSVYGLGYRLEKKAEVKK